MRQLHQLRGCSPARKAAILTPSQSAKLCILLCTEKAPKLQRKPSSSRNPLGCIRLQGFLLHLIPRLNPFSFPVFPLTLLLKSRLLRIHVKVPPLHRKAGFSLLPLSPFLFLLFWFGDRFFLFWFFLWFLRYLLLLNWLLFELKI